MSRSSIVLGFAITCSLDFSSSGRDQEVNSESVAIRDFSHCPLYRENLMASARVINAHVVESTEQVHPGANYLRHPPHAAHESVVATLHATAKVVANNRRNLNYGIKGIGSGSGGE